MNALQKTAGAILSLSLLCGMQVYAFPVPSSSGDKLYNRMISAMGLSRIPMVKVLSEHPCWLKEQLTVLLRGSMVIFP